MKRLNHVSIVTSACTVSIHFSSSFILSLISESQSECHTTLPHSCLEDEYFFFRGIGQVNSRIFVETSIVDCAKENVKNLK